MPIRHARIFPRYSFYCVLGGLAAIYVFCAMMLVPVKVYILPYLITPDFIRYKGAIVVLFLAIPCAIYLICWKGSDFFAWLRTPQQLTVGDRGLQLGERTLAFAEVTRIRHRHNRNHVLLTGRDGKTLRLRLDLWDNAGDLLCEVEEAVGEVMAHDVERRLHAGETVKFGALGLQAEGLMHKGQLIAWSSIDTIRTQSDEDGMEADEHLVIVANGKTRKIDRSKIDNEPVLLACLMQRLPAN
ncbi:MULTISPECIES: hypothetical protein [unclassified Variovorax]|jgi:hypothetical protein|uniref:hypothetical protein n=1 Tax=unclassified Variovorax TaxID=663243 RepID=UPI0008CA1B8A|nr:MULTISPECIES: hypothetical protein [unclassified Variovorax]SEJ09107.1 hypothetical protein SAMN05518853_101608 [Variovorax sp. OK202]SFB98708.1 hypothetical protein SAMN05444746_101608 [Variovorax sp. OK212]